MAEPGETSSAASSERDASITEPAGRACPNRPAPDRPSSALALFDLDFTLIPSDSGLRWARFLVGEGVLPPGTDEAYLDTCHDYVAGRIGIEALHRFAAERLLAVAVDDVPELQHRFEAVIRNELPAASRELVLRHQQAGDLCCIVTTTNEIVARPFARAFGILHLLASRPVVDGGRFRGGYHGPLCHGAEKVVRVQAWLGEQAAQSRGARDEPAAAATGFRRRIFYSDARSDLPLLEWVDEPVAVGPDPGLRAHAEARGWRIMERLE